MHQQPRGTVLLAVLVVVALLAFAGLAFTQSMMTQMEATIRFGRTVQSRAFADSGVEFIAGLLDNPNVDRTQLFNNPELFRGTLIRDGQQPMARGRFSVVSAAVHDSGSLNYGLVNCSRKLNVNALADMDESIARQLLLSLPAMSNETADAILDWIDTDDNRRSYGAESADYGFTSNDAANNRPLPSLSELIRVQGVTSELLHGEDTNRNGLLDTNENDGDLSAPNDNANGRLDCGWCAWLTVHSAESNLRCDGCRRINVNDDSLAELYDRLEPELGTAAAKFVVAWRMYGPVNSDPGDAQPIRRPNTAESMTKQADLHETESTMNDPAVVESISRGGLKLNRGPRYDFRSVFDLIDAQVPYVDESGDVLTSPWTTESSSTSDLAKLEELLTTTTRSSIVGRLNILKADARILGGLPDGVATVAERIANKADTDWQRGLVHLLVDGLVDLDELRQMEPYVTLGGDVFQTQIIGHFEVGGGYCRQEVIIDATRRPARVVMSRELTGLGRGYKRELLLPISEPDQ